jgi:large subunit ribosomal protein L5
MATLREGTRLARAVASRRTQYMPSAVIPRRWASSDAAASSPAISDVETNSSFNTPGPDDAIIKSFDTAKRIADRQQQLPGKRYVFASTGDR